MTYISGLHLIAVNVRQACYSCERAADQDAYKSLDLTGWWRSSSREQQTLQLGFREIKIVNGKHIRTLLPEILQRDKQDTSSWPIHGANVSARPVNTTIQGSRPGDKSARRSFEKTANAAVSKKVLGLGAFLNIS